MKRRRSVDAGAFVAFVLFATAIAGLSFICFRAVLAALYSDPEDSEDLLTPVETDRSVLPLGYSCLAFCLSGGERRYGLRPLELMRSSPSSHRQLSDTPERGAL